MNEFNILKDIDGYKNWKVIEPIYKGWSEDKKFFIEDNNGFKFILRLSDINLYERKKIEYENLIDLSKLEINMSIPVKFGTCNNGKNVYSLLTWIDGEDAIDILPTLPRSKQYELGVEAGKILQKIHTIKPKDNNESWESIYLRKIEKGINLYKECGYRIENEEMVINFIREHKKYLKDRPTTFQHGDYHIGNMIITPDKKLGIIDFNRSSYGDPWEEYDRFVFTWGDSKDFANGQIHGYFNNEVPEDFFKLMSLYNARNCIASIPWSIPFGEKDLKVALENNNKINDSYNGFKNYIPNWYEEDFKWRD